MLEKKLVGIGIGNDKSKTESYIVVLSTAVDTLQLAASKKVTIAEVATSPSTALDLIPPINAAVTNSNNSALSRISTRQGKKD